MKRDGPLRSALRGLAESDPYSPAMAAPGEGAISHRHLFEQVEAVRQIVSDAGLAPGERVAVVLPNGPPFAVAVLGLMTYTECAPIPQSLTPNELESSLRRLKVRGVILEKDDHGTVRKVAERLGLPSIELTPGIGCSGSSDARPVAESRSPRDVSLVLQTSGTTSTPKVVPLTQENLISSAQNTARWLELGPSDCCLNLMPLFHIHGLVAGVLVPIISGGRAILPARIVMTDFFRWLRGLKPTWCTAAPTFLRLMLEQSGDSSTNYRDTSLRFIRSSSAPLSSKLAERIETLFGVPVIQAFSMTEAAHQVTSNPLPPRTRKPGTVGLAAGTEVVVMGRNGEILLPENRGEVLIRGPGVMAAYEDNEEANADVFIEGWFRTGDEGYLDKDGYLTLTGRLKEIINRGGEKISPLEVEEVLLRHPEVSDVAVFPVPHVTLGEEVCAVVVRYPDGEVDERVLRQFAATELSPYKVPKRIVFREQIPKGATGKIQRLQLSRQLNALDEPQHRNPCDRAPTPCEAKLLSIWKRVLRVQTIGLHENFFSLGGDSLQALTLISEVSSALGIELPASAVVDGASCVSDMAVMLEQDGVESASRVPPILSAVSRKAPIVASFAQRAFWILSFLNRNQPTFNVTAALSIKGYLDIPKLTAAIDELLARHESLRTNFYVENGTLWQKHSDAVPLELDQLDVARLELSETHDQLLKAMRHVSQKPFDLTKGPLIRATLLRIHEMNHVLLIVMHHIVADGWSRHILLRDLVALYCRSAESDSKLLPKLGVQYADFASHQRKGWEEGYNEQDKEYWQRQVRAGCAPTRIPPDLLVPDFIPRWKGSSRQVTFSKSLTSSLVELANKQQTTLFVVLLSAFKLLLSETVRSTEVMVGVPFANRTSEALHLVVGSFVNVLPIWTYLGSDLTFAQLIQQLHGKTMAAYAHGSIPVEVLLDSTQIWSADAGSMSVPVLFQLRNYRVPPLEGLRDLQVEELEFDSGISPFEISVDLVERAGRLNCKFTYKTDLFEETTISSLQEGYHKILRVLVESPHKKIGARGCASRAHKFG